MIEAVQKQLEILRKADKNSEDPVYANGSRLYDTASCQVLMHSLKYRDILVSSFDEEEIAEESLF